MTLPTITIVGSLGADPELRYTSGGIAVVSLSIAVNDRKLNRQTNEWEDGDMQWYRASVWRDFAEHVAGSLTKGMRVIAQGRLRQRSYETREGEKRSTIELEVDEIGPSLRYATAQVTRYGPRGDANSSGGASWSVPADPSPQTGAQGFDGSIPF